jgi:hypothetical protein
MALKLFQMARFFNLRCTFTPCGSYIKDYIIYALKNFIAVFYETIFMFFMSCMTKMAVLALYTMCRFGLCGTEILRFLNKTDHFMFIALILVTSNRLPGLLLVNSMVMILKWFVVLHCVFPLCSLQLFCSTDFFSLWKALYSSFFCLGAIIMSSIYVYIKNFVHSFCYVLMISVVALFNNSEHKGVSLGHFI